MAEDETFKVTDRRHRDTEAPTEMGSGAARPAPSVPAGGGSHASPLASREPGGADLSGVFVMFASSALMALGEAPDPATGERSVDLAQAREAVDLLLLLRDKTSGNRTEQETRLLEDILYDLEMRVVRAAGSLGR